MYTICGPIVDCHFLLGSVALIIFSSKSVRLGSLVHSFIKSTKQSSKLLLHILRRTKHENGLIWGLLFLVFESLQQMTIYFYQRIRSAVERKRGQWTHQDNEFLCQCILLRLKLLNGIRFYDSSDQLKLMMKCILILVHFFSILNWCTFP